MSNRLLKTWTRLFFGVSILLAGLSGPADGQTATDSTQPVGPDAVSSADSILSEYIPQAPPNPTTPPYTLLRFNEDYSYLSDPRNRADPFDDLKYIPLSATDPMSYISFGGSIRERFEHFTSAGFGVPGQPLRNDYLLQRITFDADLHINQHLRIFTQGISGLQFGGDQPAPAINNDALDLQQAFVDLRFDLQGATRPEYFVVRCGRFEMSSGSGRLLATRAAPNIPFKFDGLQLIAAADDAHLYAFVTKPDREQKYSFDDEAPGQLFWGIYVTTPQLHEVANLRADVYYLGIRDDDAHYANASGVEERHTFGTRIFGKMEGFDYDTEPIVQSGRIGDRAILAWTVASSVGYTFDIAWHPRLGMNADIASGDPNHGAHSRFGTFDPLFYKAGYFSDASLIRPGNIIDIHPLVEMRPRDNLLLTFGSDQPPSRLERFIRARVQIKLCRQLARA
jgi:hypothetical protein